MARKSNDDRRAAHSAAAQKAARAGGSDRANRPSAGSRILGFPALVLVIMVLGTGLVVFARLDRDAPVRPIQNEDHWHSAYGIWDCAEGEDGAFLPMYEIVTPDPNGIHSHQDGLMHIHPFTEEASGENARLGDFIDTMQVEITDDSLGVGNGRVLEEDVTCDGEPAIIQVARWEFAFAVDESPDIFTEDMADIRFRNDGEAWVLARAPLGADIPPPESLETLATVNPNLLLPDGFDPQAEQDFLDNLEDGGDAGSTDGDTTDG
jgi:hypothetical protein